MPSLNRRTALQLGGMALTSGLAGCGTFTFRPSKPLRIAEFWVSNYDTSPHTVHVLLEDDEPVYWASKQVTPVKDHNPGGVTFEDFPDDPGNSTLHVRIDEQAKSKRVDYDLSDVRLSCIGIKLQIGAYDEPTDDLILKQAWGTTTKCEEPTTSR